MENVTQPSPRGKRLLVGVFVDDITGNIELAAGESGIDPVLVFLDALRMIEISRLEEAKRQKGPQIMVPRGPLPKLR